MPFIIKRDPIKVESIEGYSDYIGVQMGGSISLNSICYPVNASYKNSEYVPSYVIKDGVLIDSALETYVHVDALGVLTAKSTLNVGDKIGVKAHAIADDVWSEVFIIDVVKTPVMDVRIVADGFVRSIGAGERVEIFPKIYPLTASFPNCEVIVNSGNEYGHIVKEGDEEDAWWQIIPEYPARAGYKVQIPCDVVCEDGSTRFRASSEFDFIFEYVLDGNGNLINHNDISKYAYEFNGQEDGREGIVQLTNEVGSGWRIAVRLLHKQDNIKSDTYIINVY